MLDIPISDAERIRFAELAELFIECRDVYRDYATLTNWRPVDRSAAAADAAMVRQLTTDHSASAFAREAITKVLHWYLYSVSEQFNGLAALYDDPSATLVAPRILARSIVEHCAHVWWVLGRSGDQADERLARALLEEFLSQEEAKRNIGRLVDRDSDDYRREVAFYDTIKDVARTLFAEAPYRDGDRLLTLHGQKMPRPEACAVAMLTAMTRDLTERSARGLYGLLSNSAHPTLHTVNRIFSIERSDDGNLVTVQLDSEERDRHAAIVVGAYYNVISHVIQYHGWPGERHAQFNRTIDRLLPTLLPPARA